MRALRVGCLVILAVLAAACTGGTATEPTTTRVGPTATTSVPATSRGPASSAKELISCSGRRTAVSFDGMRIEYGLVAGESVKDIEVDYGGNLVFHANQLGGLFAARMKAPGSSGVACVARMAGYHEPVALVYSDGLAEGASTLEVVYPSSTGRYATTELDFPGVLGLDIRLLGGSLVMVAGDPRFSFLFTAGSGSNTPIRILRFGGGHVVDVSRRFPSLIAADAARLVRTIHLSSYRIDGVWSFIGVLEAWVADECRLGNGTQAWRSADQQVAHGPFRYWMAQNEPHFIKQLRADLVRWGYCTFSD